MRDRLTRLWVGEEAKKCLKIRATEEGITIKELLDKIAIKEEPGKNKLRRIDDYRFL